MLRLANLSNKGKSLPLISAVRHSSSFVSWLERMYYNMFPSHLIKDDKWAKLVCVEGNIGIGKDKVARAIADKFDLRHFPCANLTYGVTRLHDEFKLITKNRVAHDLSEDSLSSRCRAVSMEYFYQNPGDWEHTVLLRNYMLMMRNYQYNDATGHLLHTGQGCTIVRHFYFDKVFAEAQKAMHWFTDKPELQHQTGMAYKFYDKLFYTMNQWFYPPQVIIYMNVPAEQAYDMVQCGDNEYEKLLPLEYFKKIEEVYPKYLDMSRQKGVNVIEVDGTDMNIPNLLHDLDDIESLDIPFSRWNETILINEELRDLKRKCFDPNFRNELMRLYTPVESNYLPKDLYLQIKEDLRVVDQYRMGFNPGEGSPIFKG